MTNSVEVTVETGIPVVEVTVTSLPQIEVNVVGTETIEVDFVAIPEVSITTAERGPQGPVGPTGPQGIPGTAGSIGIISDVDVSGAINGSLLIYNDSINKWKASTTLSEQNMEGGEY